MARKRGEDSEREDPQASEESADDAADEAESQGGDESSDEQQSSSGGSEDISDTPAPSVGPHTTFEKRSPEERLARHEQSDKDAMGLDKRREVIGGTYGPTLARQATMYGIFIGVVAAIGIGFYLLAKDLDQPPAKYEDKAPWSQADASQREPAPIDFPRYGHPGPGEQPEATPGEQRGAASSETTADSSESH